jgi:hypothetical protein
MKTKAAMMKKRKLMTTIGKIMKTIRQIMKIKLGKHDENKTDEKQIVTIMKT